MCQKRTGYPVLYSGARSFCSLTSPLSWDVHGHGRSSHCRIAILVGFSSSSIGLCTPSSILFFRFSPILEAFFFPLGHVSGVFGLIFLYMILWIVSHADCLATSKWGVTQCTEGTWWVIHFVWYCCWWRTLVTTRPLWSSWLVMAFLVWWLLCCWWWLQSFSGRETAACFLRVKAAVHLVMDGWLRVGACAWLCYASCPALKLSFLGRPELRPCSW